MKIEIKRRSARGEVIDGKLYIADVYVCDTAENVTTALPKGTYTLALERCKQYGRKMPVVSSTFDVACCETCAKIAEVNNNTHMPKVCHMIKPGNGVYSRCDGSIVVGETIVSGCLRHPKQHFEQLAERLRKAISRGGEIMLIIR